MHAIHGNQSSQHETKQDWQPRTIVDDLARKEAEGVVEEDGEAEEEVLVEEVGDHARDAQVGPAPVHQQQRLQESKLRDCKVTAHHRLHPLLPADAHTCVASSH